MILLKLTRDQARCIEQNIFPLMISFAEMRISNTFKLTDEYFSAKVLSTLLLEVQKIFKRKLLSDANKFGFKFNDAQAITFYSFLFKHPIDSKEIYLLNLRQQICDVLYQQFNKP